MSDLTKDSPRAKIFAAIREAKGRIAPVEVPLIDTFLTSIGVPLPQPGTPFDAALAAVLKHEGGYSNHPRDPGGSTMRGVTQRTYDDWRRGQGLSPRSVRQIENAELRAIYKRDYWDKVKGDDLPAGVAYATFDFAVNSGVSRASKYLQAAAGVAQDGVIGPATVAAAKADPAGVITRLMDARVKFLRGLETFDTFGRGWMSRCDGVRRVAGEMCG
jgi:lysozyme family protein